MFGIRDRLIDTAVKMVDLVISGDLVRKAKDVADTGRGREPRQDAAPYSPPYTPPAPEAPGPAPAAKATAAPAYQVLKGELWDLTKDGEVVESHKRKQDTIKAGRTAARAAKGTLAILKLDGTVGEEVDYGAIL